MLKGKILVQSRESEEQNQLIRNDKQVIMVQLHKLKAQKTQARARSKENLVKLTLESTAALQALRKTVDKVSGGDGTPRTRLTQRVRPFPTQRPLPHPSGRKDPQTG